MISVCMATYNGERYIKRQIDSILYQLGEDDELIISDDGSTDRTLEIIKKYNDSRIKIYEHIKKAELSKVKKLRNFYYATSNFENALIHSRGEYIFLADQDDIWESEKVKIMVEELKSNNFDLVMCNYSIIDNDEQLVETKFYEVSPISKYRLMNILKSKYLGCCMAFSRNLLNKALPFPRKLLAHDYWIGCLSSNFSFIDIPLHKYRRHTWNVSSSSEKSNNSFVLKISYRIKFLVLLLYRLINLNIKKGCRK